MIPFIIIIIVATSNFSFLFAFIRSGADKNIPLESQFCSTSVNVTDIRVRTSAARMRF